MKIAILRNNKKEKTHEALDTPPPIHEKPDVKSSGEKSKKVSERKS